MNHNPHLSPSSIDLTIKLELDSHDLTKMARGREVYKEYFTSDAHYLISVQKMEENEDDLE